MRSKFITQFKTEFYCRLPVVEKCLEKFLPGRKTIYEGSKHNMYTIFNTPENSIFGDNYFLSSVNTHF